MNAILALGTLLHRRYEIIRLLGQGDFGAVYRARDRRGASPPSLVAVKQMPVQIIVGFIARMLGYPNSYPYTVVESENQHDQPVDRGREPRQFPHSH